MPTPRSHGGAAIAHIPMTTPGFMGLNTEQSSGLLGPEWATVLTNAVIDANGRVAARKGWDNAITSVIAAQFTNIGEYVKSDGTTELHANAGAVIYKSGDGGSTWSDVTGTATPTSGALMTFHNFNNLMVALQDGEAPAIYNGTSYVTVADGNAPQGVVGCSAFGRMWVADDDGHTVKYCALLDGTNWTNAGAGSIDMWNVWPGNDTVTAITSFNGSLVVFGKRAIIIWTDGAGSALGIDPTSMYVVDVIQGVGCITQMSLQHVDGDLWFLSEHGLQSLGRLIQEKSNPVENLSKNVQGNLQATVAAATLSRIRSAYSPVDRVYLLSLSSGGSEETGRCIVFDTRGRLQDGSARCMGTWTLVPTAVVVRRNGDLGIQTLDTNANYGLYTGQLDDSASYPWEYESGWLDPTQQGFLLFPKRMSGVFFADNDFTINFKYALDFETTFTTRDKTFEASGGVAGEWGLAEWGLAEFGGGVNLHAGQVTASKSGEYIKIGLSCTINNTVLSVQQVDLFCKIGRYA